MQYLNVHLTIIKNSRQVLAFFLLPFLFELEQLDTFTMLFYSPAYRKEKKLFLLLLYANVSMNDLTLNH